MSFAFSRLVDDEIGSLKLQKSSLPIIFLSVLSFSQISSNEIFNQVNFDKLKLSSLMNTWKEGRFFLLSNVRLEQKCLSVIFYCILTFFPNENYHKVFHITVIRKEILLRKDQNYYWKFSGQIFNTITVYNLQIKAMFQYNWQPWIIDLKRITRYNLG